MVHVGTAPCIIAASKSMCSLHLIKAEVPSPLTLCPVVTTSVYWVSLRPGYDTGALPNLTREKRLHHLMEFEDPITCVPSSIICSLSLQKSVGVDEAHATCCCAGQFWICIGVGPVPRQVVTKNQTRMLEFGGYVRMGVRDDTIALHNVPRER